jgi:predicted SnoaL-like aldol condensation-catalyzing enzyme
MLKAFNGEEDPKAIKELFHPKIVDHSDPIGLEPQLRRQDPVARVQAEVMREKEVFPDRKFKEVALVAEGDRVVLRWEMTGTNKGDVLGRKATGKKVKTFGTEYVRIKDGKIVEHDDDPGHVLHLLEQLGMLDQEILKKPEMRRDPR